jgi:hypothetical protein
VASCASLRSKNGKLFFLIHFFPKGLLLAPFFHILATFCHKKKCWSQFGGSHNYKTKKKQITFPHR